MSSTPSKKAYYVLADCNNFYVSCERMFNPRLEGKPVVVLSQNDGCIIARSQEAKKLGIKMGEPYFKVKDRCELAKVIVYSSNYQLYGDISERVMQTLAQFSPDIEVYSIDEAFMTFPQKIAPEEMFKQCMGLKKLVKKWVGIPVSIGIAPTKTLAKIANYLAKKNREIGVFSLVCPLLREGVLQKFPIGEVWGIGSSLNQRLRGMEVFTVRDFINMDSRFVRKKMGVIGERIWWELNGIPALELEESSARKSISFTRSFGRIVTEFLDIAEALSTFVSKACVRLRQQHSCASAIQIYLETVLFEENRMVRKPYGMVVEFPMPTNDTSLMISTAKNCLKQLYQGQQKYKRCGIFLLDLIPESKISPDLFLENIDPKRTKLMHTIDALNARFGKNAMFFGAVGVNQNWKSRSQQRSRYNTTSWACLPLAYA